MQENKFFSLNAIKETPAQKREGVFSTYLNHHLEKIKKVEDLIRIPQEGEIFYIFTENAFNAFTLIPFIAKRYFIKEIFASTYSISRRVVEALQELQQSGKVGEVTLLISDSMIKRNPVTIETLEAVVRSNPNFKTKYYWNHSKVTLIKAVLEEQEFNLVMEGSGNWSENAQLEQYTITNHPEVYDFYKTMFEK